MLQPVALKRRLPNECRTSPASSHLRAIAESALPVADCEGPICLMKLSYVLDTALLYLFYCMTKPRLRRRAHTESPASRKAFSRLPLDAALPWIHHSWP